MYDTSLLEMDRKSKEPVNERSSLCSEVTDFTVATGAGRTRGGNVYSWGSILLTLSASQPRCLISRLPAMPVFPSCSLTSAITWVSRSLTLEWMALNQAWAVAESLLLRITVCLASGEWISSCLEKQREKGQKVSWQVMLCQVLGHKGQLILYSDFWTLSALHGLS